MLRKLAFMILTNKNPQNPANQHIYNKRPNYYRRIKTSLITTKNHIQFGKKEYEAIPQPKAKTAYFCLYPAFLFFCNDIVT